MSVAACLASLTDAQRHAVTHDPSTPLQILAGPGSGKTRVLTARAAWLVAGAGAEGSGTPLRPENCVVVTFTNKAANEMRTRLEGLIGAQTRRLMLGTFHALCAALLRRHGARIDIAPNFSIADRDSSSRIMRRVFDAQQGATDDLTPDRALAQISAAKARGQSPAHLGPGRATLAALYHEYQAELRAENALDFDDILLCGTQLAREHGDIVRHVEHVLVDEFQDTNRTQYELMTHLAARGCVTVVGDPDQSIYGWRCADAGNLARMQRDFPGTRAVYLEQNFRSCGTILDAAMHVVRQDHARINKGLYTHLGRGTPVSFRRLASADDEAEFVALEIERLITLFAPALTHADCAVLFRSNAQSRALESALQRARIPYRLVGAARFFDRAEVKDLLAYLLVVDNPAYTTALLRIANVPRRGIGAKSLDDLRIAAAARREPLLHTLEAVADARAGAPPARSTLLSGIRDLVRTLRTLRRAAAERMAAADLLRLLLTELDFAAHLRRDDGFEARWENVQELISFAAATDRECADSASPAPSPAPAPSPLRALLESGALASDEQSDDTPKVTLSTCHGAKGLEWPVVFVVAAEAGNMPLYRATTPAEVCEERRLLYVAMTRAASNLYLTCAARRMAAGALQTCALSPFLEPLVPTAHGGKCTAKSDWCFATAAFGQDSLDVLAALLGRAVPPLRVLQERARTHAASRSGARLASLGHAEPPRAAGGFVSAVNAASAASLGRFAGTTTPPTTSMGRFAGAGSFSSALGAFSQNLPVKRADSGALSQNLPVKRAADGGGGGAPPTAKRPEMQQQRRPRLGVGRPRRLC